MSQGHRACRHWAGPGFLALNVGSGEPGADVGHLWSLRGLVNGVGCSGGFDMEAPRSQPQCSTLSHKGLCWFLFQPPAARPPVSGRTVLLLRSSHCFVLGPG